MTSRRIGSFPSTVSATFPSHGQISFRTHKHLSSWVGTCPGNNESAGKRKSGKTPKGNRWLRGALGEAAWAASHKKNTYLAA